MTQLDNTIRRVSAITGIFLGIVLLAVNMAYYYLLIYAIKSAWQIVISQVVIFPIVPIIAALPLCFNLRKRIGGYWTFRQAATGIFIMFVVGYATLSIGRDLIFAKFVEPDMAKKTEAAMLNAVTVSYKNSGKSQAEIDQKKADIQKKFNDQKTVTTGHLIFGYVITMVLLFIPALIFASLLRRNSPEYQTYTHVTQ